MNELYNYCVYRITNTVNGKVYFGITYDFKKRMGEHRRSTDKYPIHQSIRKYGWDKFKCEIIIDDITRRAAECFEKYFISRNNTTNKKYGYNIARGGGLIIDPNTGRGFGYDTTKYGVSSSDDHNEYQRRRYHSDPERFRMERKERYLKGNEYEKWKLKFETDPEYAEQERKKWNAYNNSHKPQRSVSKHNCYINNRNHYLEKARERRESDPEKVKSIRNKSRYRCKFRKLLEKHLFSPNVDHFAQYVD